MMRKWAMVLFTAVVLVLFSAVGALRADPPAPPSFEERQARALEDIARTLKRMEDKCR